MSEESSPPSPQSPLTATLPLDYLTKPQLAELLQVSPRTVDVWMKDNRLKYKKIGRTVRFKRDDLFTV